MVDTETSGALCPSCEYRNCEVKYHDCSSSWLTYLACPKCGFAYAEGGDKGYGGKWLVHEIWGAIEEHYGMTRRQIYDKYKNDVFSDDQLIRLWDFTEDDVKEFKKLKLPLYN